MKKILLIAYKFPPYSGVGGYRWSKLCKYLARLDYQIHVVTIDWAQSGPNTLIEDVQHPHIVIHRLPVSLLHRFRYWTPKKRIAQRLKWRLFKHIIDPLFFFDDEAQHWGPQLIPFCSKLIREERIRTLIATGHPFSSNYLSVSIKRACENLKLVQDYQDFWVQNPFKKYSRRQYNLVARWQRESVEFADKVVAVSKTLVKMFTDGTTQKKNFVVENGFDPAALDELSKIAANSTKDATFVYIGNLYNGRHVPLFKFLEAIEKILPNFSEIKIKIAGGTIPKSIKYRFSELFDKKIIEYMGVVSQVSALAFVKNSRFALHVNAKETTYALSSKIYEYAMLRVPTISINYGGEVEEFINETDIGYSLHANDSDLSAKLTDILKGNDLKFRYNIADRNYETLALKYIDIIEKQ